MSAKSPGNKQVKEVRKPFLTGDPTDENTVKTSLLFFGSLFLVYFITFMICSIASFSNTPILRIIVNLLILAASLVIFYNNGTNQGAEAVARGEILYQKQEKGLTFSKSEKSVCFHKMKGFITGLLGTLPLVLVALIFAFTVQITTTEAGTLPSWMQAYIRRPEIGDALIHYTQPAGMGLTDILRIVIRVALMPVVNLIGTENPQGLLVMERLSPLLILMPAVAYGIGYLTGRSIRTKVHTAISESNRKRERKERKARKARRERSAFRPPEKLN